MGRRRLKPDIHCLVLATPTNQNSQESWGDQFDVYAASLAAKCDVSRSMISLVQRGESSPTAVVLEKIASGLGVPLATTRRRA
jgi:transcriptional regulator with XRE-family HTH domain